MGAKPLELQLKCDLPRACVEHIRVRIVSSIRVGVREGCSLCRSFRGLRFEATPDSGISPTLAPLPSHTRSRISSFTHALSPLFFQPRARTPSSKGSNRPYLFMVLRGLKLPP